MADQATTLVESGREQLRKTVSSDMNGSKPKVVGPEEARQDLEASVGAFAHATDTMTEALLLILGKFDRALRLLVISIALGTLALVSVAFELLRMERMANELDKDRGRIETLIADLHAVQADLKASRVDNRKTQEAVEEVRAAAAEEAGKISIVADPSGKARLVIKTTPPPASAAPSRPLPKAGLGMPAPSASAPAPAAATAIELPVQLPPGARVVPGDGAAP